jgi:hypothetical protein
VSDLPRTVRGHPLASAVVCGGCYSVGYSPAKGGRVRPCGSCSANAAPPPIPPSRAATSKSLGTRSINPNGLLLIVSARAIKNIFDLLSEAQSQIVWHTCPGTDGESHRSVRASLVEELPYLLSMR